VAKSHTNLTLDFEIKAIGERLAYQHRRSFSAFVEDLILEKQQALEQGTQTLPYAPSQPSKKSNSHEDTKARREKPRNTRNTRK